MSLAWRGITDCLGFCLCSAVIPSSGNAHGPRKFAPFQEAAKKFNISGGPWQLIAVAGQKQKQQGRGTPSFTFPVKDWDTAD